MSQIRDMKAMGASTANLTQEAEIKRELVAYVGFLKESWPVLLDNKGQIL